jgi:hypothetical protein
MAARWCLAMASKPHASSNRLTNSAENGRQVVSGNVEVPCLNMESFHPSFYEK